MYWERNGPGRADRAPGRCRAGEEVAWRHTLTGRSCLICSGKGYCCRAPDSTACTAGKAQRTATARPEYVPSPAPSRVVPARRPSSDRLDDPRTRTIKTARTTNAKITTGATYRGIVSSSARNVNRRKFNVTRLLLSLAIHRGVEGGLVDDQPLAPRPLLLLSSTRTGVEITPRQCHRHYRRSCLLPQIHRPKQLPKSGQFER
jgi:hypothetical protein